MEPELSELLQRDDGPADPRLFALLYTELRRVAEHRLRSAGPGCTMSTTTLVHETYLSMAGTPDARFPDRARFFAYASRAMRGLVINYSRQRRAVKRDRGFEITLTEGLAEPSGAVAGEDLEALDEALDRLAGLDLALAELVDLHFFGGFTFGEIAEMREVSERTVQRDWRKARVLLRRALSEDSEPGSGG